MRLPAGTRLFKASKYPEEWARDTLSAWWSTVEKSSENENSAVALFETAKVNQVSFRELIRMISAVPVDWNTLNWYIEIEAKVDLYGFWGQFAPQKGVHATLPQGITAQPQPAAGGVDSYIDYGDGQAVYLPALLGGTGAWQLYIPNFDKHLIDPVKTKNIPILDNQKLAEHFYFSA